MVLLQFVPTEPVKPCIPEIRILEGGCIYSPEELKFWQKKHWVVLEKNGKFLTRKLSFTSKIDSSMTPEYPSYWVLKSNIQGSVIFHFSGITPTKSFKTVAFKDEVSFVEKTKRIDRHCLHGFLNGSEFKLEWRETLQDKNPSDLILSYQNRKQVIGTIPGWSTLLPIWVGDLNGDGQIDLLVKSESDKGTGNTTFFLGVDDPVNIVNVVFFESSSGE